MIGAAHFLEAARERGVRLWSGVPCSYLKPFINYAIDSDTMRYVAAANEGEAVAVAAGAELGGTLGAAMFQNSGLGNAVNPLTSLTHTFGIPMLLVVTHRGEPGGAPDEPQHELMGAITTRTLDVLGVPWERFPTEPDAVEPALDRATGSMYGRSEPFAFVMSKGSVEPHALQSKPSPRAPGPALAPEPAAAPSASRRELLAAVRSSAHDTDVLIATTGYTGRELYALEDSANQLYVVGSMGCASSLGLGLALARPERRVIVLDGDGAALMRLGALATIGYERPPNLLHVVLDNGRHESTGGQSTVSHTTDLAAVAAACGYPNVQRANEPEALAEIVRGPGQELTLVHCRVKPGVTPDLPRPTVKPREVAARLRAYVGTRLICSTKRA